MKVVQILLLATSVMVLSAQGRSLQDNYRPPRMASELAKEPKVGQPTQMEDVDIDPTIGRSLTTVFINDIINIITAPGSESWG